MLLPKDADGWFVMPCSIRCPSDSSFASAQSLRTASLGLVHAHYPGAFRPVATDNVQRLRLKHAGRAMVGATLPVDFHESP